jgi:enoyl-CoA hydratase/carnithine racemase
VLSFCAGVDLDEFKSVQRTPLEERDLLTHRVHQVAHAMEALSKPAIAAVNGVAVGASMDMALMCDVRLASDSARFSEGYIRVGLVPGDGGCYYLPRLIGREQVLRMLSRGLETRDPLRRRGIPGFRTVGPALPPILLGVDEVLLGRELIIRLLSQRPKQ